MTKKWLPFRLHRITNATTRLALSYLAIIMLLSTSFSVIFYWTSTKGLDFQKKSAPTSGTEAPDAQRKLIVGTNNTGEPETITADSAEELQKQFQERIAEIRTSLLQQLIALNSMALLFGSILSFYLARRTLRPIEIAIEAQQRFAADASHELRTPLTIMQTEIEVALGKQQLTLARARRALQSNYQEVVRLRQLSEGLLQLARSTESVSAHEPVAVMLDETVNDAVNQVMKLAQTKHVAIHTAMPRILAKGDHQSILQTLTILLDNAIKYSSSGDTITIESSEKQGYAYLSVRDEGPGIPAKDLPYIFDRFYRAGPLRSKQTTGGYGLGLSIAKRLIEQYGGTIAVESTLKKGSTFTIKLPNA